MSGKLLRKNKPEKNSQTSYELSTNKLAPGIIKIYGGNVSQGSHYKAVRATSISSAGEVVKNALEKYAIDSLKVKEYVLCDVVGEFVTANDNGEDKKAKKKLAKKKSAEYDDLDNQPIWNTIYVRAVNDNEKPLILQSLWKPTDGKCRRFELRKKIEMESSCFFINTSVSMGRRDSEISLFDYSDYSNESDNNVSSAISSPKVAQKPKQVNNNDDKLPANEPYLLLLRGSNPIDNLVHRLTNITMSVGPYKDKSSEQHDIILYSPDVLLQVALIHKKVKPSDNDFETNVDDIDFNIHVEPTNRSLITINGVALLSTTILKPGQLISFGENYLFLFKDPSQVHDLNLELSWFNNIKQTRKDFDRTLCQKNSLNSLKDDPMEDNIFSLKDQGTQVEILSESSSSNQVDIDSDDDSEILSDDSFSTEEEKMRKLLQKSKLQLSYNIREEDNFLHAIIEITDEELNEFGVLPAYFFLMAVEHSAAMFTEIQTRKLLLKIASGMQGIAWEKTKGIGKQAIKEQTPIVLLKSLLSELTIVLFWMTNTLEMLHYLQCNLKRYLLPQEQVKSNQEAILTADEELLSVLEEVIMFTFQQTVYHLTKVLYISLPSIIDNHNENVTYDADGTSSIESISDVFTQILHTTNKLQVHPQITSQLFAYLFFFSNASLFNYLVEKGPAYKIFNWEGGKQLKNNLNIIHECAKANKLGVEFDKYMSSFNAVVKLLATPKAMLTRTSWKQFREQFPALKPAQLQFILEEYNLNGEKKPRHWYPLPDEVESALQLNDLLESFATHPPLVLPSSQFVVDLNGDPPSEQFTRYLCMLSDAFDKKTKDMDTTTNDQLNCSIDSFNDKTTRVEQI